ncbi:hypothetical protein CVT25_006627 [Psilocybe cyanescens]|uniref:Uncharacterized protein n=1 Tax=Psilocybe cyanescens TaxID=93625 RepID=A0A409XIS9_PSICY|nr:hypothetical protein CVT25_006627 [Psilocybe cyanescens]
MPEPINSPVIWAKPERKARQEQELSKSGARFVPSRRSSPVPDPGRFLFAQEPEHQVGSDEYHSHMTTINGRDQ